MLYRPRCKCKNSIQAFARRLIVGEIVKIHKSAFERLLYPMRRIYVELFLFFFVIKFLRLNIYFTVYILQISYLTIIIKWEHQFCKNRIVYSPYWFLRLSFERGCDTFDIDSRTSDPNVIIERKCQSSVHVPHSDIS